MAEAARRTRRCSSCRPVSASSPGRRPAPSSWRWRSARSPRNGIRRFCLADPMNDAAAQRRLRAHGQAGRRRIRDRGAGLSRSARSTTTRTMPPRARKLAASPDVDALYIKDPGGLLTPEARAHADPRDPGRDRRQAAGAARPLHDRPRRADLYRCRRLRRRRRAVRLRRARRTAPPIRRSTRMVANLRALGHTVDIDEDAAREVGRYFTALAEAEGLPVGQAAGVRRRLSAPPAAGRHGRHDAPPPGRAPRAASRRRGDRGDWAACARSSAGRS